MRLDRQELLRLTGLGLAAFLVRLVYVWGEYSLSPDGVYYAWLGDALVSGDLTHGLSTYWPPLYPLLVGIAGRVLGDLELGGRIVSALCGSLLLLPAYCLMRNTWGRRVALLGALLLVFEPQLARNSSKVMTDIPFTLCFAVAVLAAGSALFDRRRRAALGAGLAFGAAYLMRPEAFFFPLLVALLLVGSALLDVANRRTLGARLVLLLVSFFAVAGPYLVYLRAETGRFTISGKVASHVGQERYSLSLIRGELTNKDIQRAGRRLETRVRSGEDRPADDTNPVVYRGGLRWHVKKVARNINTMFDYMFPQVFFAFIPILVGIGLARTGRTSSQAGWELYLLTMVGATFAGYAVTLPIPRYLVPTVPIVIGWVAQGLVEIDERWQGARRKGFHRFPAWTDRLVLPAAVLVLFGSLLSPITAPFRWAGDDQPYEMRIAGEWIRDHGKPDSVVLAHNPVSAFYAEAEHFYAPNEPLEVVLQYARKRRADYLVLARYEDRGQRYQFEDRILGAETLPEELEQVFVSEKAPGAKVFVFAFRDW